MTYCQGCGITKEENKLCPSCAAALKTGRMFNATFNEGKDVTISKCQLKIVIMIDGGGASGDTLEEAFNMAGLRL